MPNDDEEHLNQITARVESLPSGETYTLTELFGDEWEQFLGNICPNALGRTYARAVDQGLIHHSRFYQVDRSPRMSRYIKA
jgi:hypothetical protein